jgi:phage gpG-like protein
VPTLGSLLELAALCVEWSEELHHEQRHTLELAAKMIEVEAKSYPGHYQPGWPPLKPDTIARKATGDSPLFETGELRASYSHQVLNDHEAEVGSNDDKALWHELGTTRGIPPRPVLSTAAIKKIPEIIAVTGEAVVGVLTKRP